ncbi:transcription factor HIVEP3 [Kryptolebias marmoratus]|uniref:HIVEP zinc finger 3a n=1 Tax=Kryptolebias marmoratus TaxID=37003 RepID=A0A3Q3BDV4_KRYMA|nr:transcription factor HIVEP3 [Kryptolebias marmoratus]XP_024866885.1 transcription factor HIVEP3 [Kryptolebias marmoratus]
MEALHSQLMTGEQSGGPEHHQPESPQCKSPSQPCLQQQTSSSKPHGAPQQLKQSRRQNPERKRLRHQRQSVDLDTVLEPKQEATAAAKQTAISSLSSGVLRTSADPTTESTSETQEDNPKQKRERKPQRPGKYVCTYCGRACAKPSVLQKHIRSHTGERPYPCAPCGFSFKTKSNLYKHRKSHTHRVKAGLALGETESYEDQITESEDESKQLSSVSSLTERQSNATSVKSHEIAKDCTGGSNDSYAVKKRLALRLSRGKHALQDSSDQKISSLTLGSKGSTESGYFSRSESTEQSQDSPPNTSAKSYAEIILGKYGRLGQLQRMSHHQNQNVSGEEEKNISFTVPKKQVIDHITKLITINEAVVDTSKIDSVKPRRFSLSRKNSSEAQRSPGVKEQLIHSPKAGDLGYKSTGSISMGVPCEKFHHPSLKAEQVPSQISTASLVRSHSMPSASSSCDAPSVGSGKFRLSQSFDEQQPSGTQASRRYGTLRRQPAIEIPLGTELTKEEYDSSHSFYPQNKSTVAEHKQYLPQPYECEACGTGCKDWEGYKKHKQNLCFAHHPQIEMVMGQMEPSQLSNHSVRAGASTIRKRRKEESFEFDDPSSLLPLSGECKTERCGANESTRRSALQTCSVIQHTSSFEKQESFCHDNQSLEKTKNSPPHEEYQLASKQQPQHQATKHTARKLVRQNNVQVPEILVTEDIPVDIPETSLESTNMAKNLEKLDEFHWPLRSPSLAQLPIEKLPPKKKRLRLAEAAQSSGESSFDSISLPRSPGQDSSASFASSRSTSYEEPNRADMEMATSTPLRRSRAPHMLTVPGVHQHREMRRSASEQAPHDPQPSILMAETRSKSFDYSCLSPERSAVGWKERRKCLLTRQAAIRDREEQDDQCTILNRSPEHVSPSRSSQANPSSVYYSRSSSSPLSSGKCLSNPEGPHCKDIFSQWKLSQNIQLMASTELPKTSDLSVGVMKEASCIQAPQPSPTYGASGAARAHYLPMSTGLKLEIPTQHKYSEVQMGHSHIQQPVPHITSSLELLRPLTSPAVAVRLQTDTLFPACAIYTTLSQSTSLRPQEAVDAVSPFISITAAEYRNHKNRSLDLHLWSDDGLRLPGSGGNKRMLSPSNSIELHPESQQQQKRVKEEEEEEEDEEEVGCTGPAAVDRFNQELKEESQSCLPDVCCSISSVEASFPSLLSSTCNSWCYLNYIKPNPSALDEQKPSVYSSWSTSSYDPNPPGLSSKTALSLLHCKQRLSPTIYTTSPMSVRMAETREPEDDTPVSNSPSCSRDHEGMGKEPLATESEEKEEKERPKEQVRRFSRNNQPPEALMSESGSETQVRDVHGGGGGKCGCKEVLSTQSPHCSSTRTPAGSLVEHLTPESHRKEASSHPEDTHEGDFIDRLNYPVQQKDVQELVEKVDMDAARDKPKDRCGRHEGAEGEKSPTGGQLKEFTSSSSLLLPSRDGTKKSSASAKRALFARRRLNASASTSPPPHPSPMLSCSPAPPPSASSSSGPAQWESPLRVPTPGQSLGSDSSGPPCSTADCSVQSQACRPLKDQLSAERLSASDVGLVHISPHSTRPRGSNSLLSHLPLHSQQPGRTPSLLISIGGIHMIQPRSTLPLYSLVGCRTAPAAEPPNGRLAVTHQPKPPKEMVLPSSRAAPQTSTASGQEEGERFSV